MKKKLTILYYWYLFNYRGVHHFISLFMLSVVLYFIWDKEIFSDFFICSISLVLNYFLTNWSIKKVGLDKTIRDRKMIQILDK